MFRYCIPFYYTIHSRSSGLHFLSYFLMVMLPPFIIWYSNNLDSEIVTPIFLYLLGFIGMLSIYEIGYIWNDTVCIKKDPNPTKRISEQESVYLLKIIKLITAIKIIISIIFANIAACFIKSDIVLLYIINLCILLITYALHNHFRNNINYFTVFILTTLNYFIPLIFVESEEFLILDIFIILVLFSVPKTFFYILRKKNSNVNILGDKGFIIYYLFVSVIAFFLAKQNVISYLLFLLPFCLCIYRLVTYLVKNKRGV